MNLQPMLKVEYALESHAIGVMQQASKFSSDTLATLMGIDLPEMDGLHFEPNTGCVILRPVARHRDLGQAHVTTNVNGGDTGLWRDCTKRSTGKKTLAQYNGAAGATWSAQTSAAWLALDNQPFVVSFYFGAVPKAGSHTSADAYRRVTWPADAASGENMYRVTVSYEEAPYLERSTDAGATWQRQGTIPCPIDLETLRTSANVQLSLTVLPLDDAVLFWLGQDLGRYTKVVRGDGVGYKSGALKFEGKNGVAVFGYSDLRFKASGHYVSARHRGPRDMTPTPAFHLNGAKEADQSYSAALENVYAGDFEYDYRLSMASPPLAAPDTDVSDRTPLVKQVNVVWPPIYTGPSSGGWTEITGITRYEERFGWDPETRLFSRWMSIEAKNNAGEWREGYGIQAVRVFTGYAHLGFNPDPRSYLLGNTRGAYPTQGSDATYRFECRDLLYVLKDAFLTDAIYPARWCVYSLVRALLQHGGIVPDLMATLPVCPFGPDPAGCTHTQLGAHPGWREGTGVLACLAELQAVEYASMGQRWDGQFLFQPFDPDAPYTVSKVFREQASGNGEGFNEILAHSGGLLRERDLDGVRNEITFIGIDQATGGVFARHWQDADSLNDRTAPNYTGYRKPEVHIWSGYVSPAFADAALAKRAKWARLPDERVVVPCWGQPWLQPLDVIGVQEGRSIGYGSGAYFLTGIQSVFEPPYGYFSVLYGQWTGQGDPPGTF